MTALSDQEIEAILLHGEADCAERKRGFSRDDASKIREAVCAFANDLPDRRRPGVVFVGVTDEGGCANFPITDDLLLRLAHLRDDGSITPFPQMEVRKIAIRGCEMAVIIVQPAENPPIRFEGRTWIRVGPRRGIASPSEEARLIEKRRWGTLPYDAQPVNGTNVDDIDIIRFENEYVPALISRDTIAQNERTVRQKLLGLRLIRLNDTPTITAILMLGKLPQAWIPGAYISWRRVLGTSLTDVTADERVITGTIPDQIRRIEEIMDAVISISLELGETTHKKAADYPLSALQQLVRNALMHRTYEGTNAPVRVTWYSDRVEILSPGGPYGAVTRSNFGQPGFADYRNPTLAEALKGYGFVERFGQGLEIVRRSLEANGNPPAQFDLQPVEAPSWVNVTVWKAP
jgi:ATP-dependent DNA helicase RecG